MWTAFWILQLLNKNNKEFKCLSRLCQDNEKGIACAPVLFPFTSAKMLSLVDVNQSTAELLFHALDIRVNEGDFTAMWKLSYWHIHGLQCRFFRGTTHFCEYTELLLKLQSLQHWDWRSRCDGRKETYQGVKVIFVSCYNKLNHP